MMTSVDTTAGQDVDGRTTEDLMADVATGDLRAFELLYEQLAGMVVGTVNELLPDPAHAEEVAGEVFLDLWAGTITAGLRDGLIRLRASFDRTALTEP